MEESSFTDQEHQRAGPYVIEWGVELEAQHSAWAQTNRSESTTTTAKRPASSIKDGSGPNKKAKTGDNAVTTDEEMAEFFEQNSISKVSAWPPGFLLPSINADVALFVAFRGCFEGVDPHKRNGCKW